MTDGRADQNDSVENDAGQTDAKAAFRAALERKQGRRHPHESASQNDAKVSESHAAAGAKRQFRRKSGG